MNITLSTAFQEELLVNSWKRCWDGLFREQDDLLRDTIIWRYSEPVRAYHNISHLIGCLLEFKQVSKLAVSPKLVELAIWFHDVVYNVHSSLNEVDSALAMHSAINRVTRDIEAHENNSYISYCTKLIRATEHKDYPTTADAKLICDIDLVTLGSDQETFDTYCTKIRKEYADVPDSMYYTGRLYVLGTFIKRPRIYHTRYFNDKYEKQARKNLSREIRRLKKLVR